MDTRTSPAGGQSYTQILKSTMLIGGSTIVTVVFAVIRNKATAVLLGPEGVGLMGLYNAIADIAQALAGLGVQASGVRQIAEAAGTGDSDRIARSATVLRRLSTVLGLAGALLLVMLALPIADFTFGDHQHAGGVALLSLAVFFRVISAGQTALIQGMRGIGDLARINVSSAFLGTVIGIPLIYFFGAQGIVPSLVAAAAVLILASSWYSRRLQARAPAMSARELGWETKALLKLGFVFMVSGLLTFGTAYAIRIIVLGQGGVVAAGLYQAAWALGGLYSSFILQAMGTDFYPRLTAVSNDNAECNRLVNEQAEISMLLAGPGLLATLTLAPFVMRLFYSSEFYPAVDILRWICLGMMLRVVAWPMGFIVLAKGAQTIFFWTEVAAAVVHVGLVWLLVAALGWSSAGAAFFGLYVWHSILIYVIARRLTGFRWSAANRRHASIFLPVSGTVFCAFQFLPLWQATLLGLTTVALSGFYSLRMLMELVPAGLVPPAIRAWIVKSA
jgi:PST family polysaccharide transporter